MRKSLIFLALSVSVAPPALHAQHAMDSADSPSHHMAMMMEQHHTVAAIDLLVANRDSLKLTDDQLEKLADLRARFAQAGGHAMPGAGTGTRMGHGMAMGQGKAMEHPMTPRGHIAFDRIPGKMVPRVHRSPADNSPMCPFAILTGIQRERAHQLLDRHQG